MRPISASRASPQADHPDGGELRLAYRFTAPAGGDYTSRRSVRPGGEGLQLFVGRYNL